MADKRTVVSGAREGDAVPNSKRYNRGAGIDGARGQRHATVVNPLNIPSAAMLRLLGQVGGQTAKGPAVPRR